MRNRDQRPIRRQYCIQTAAPSAVTASPDTHPEPQPEQLSLRQHGVVVHGEGWNRGDDLSPSLVHIRANRFHHARRLIANTSSSFGCSRYWPRTNINSARSSLPPAPVPHLTFSGLLGVPLQSSKPPVRQLVKTNNLGMNTLLAH